MPSFGMETGIASRHMGLHTFKISLAHHNDVTLDVSRLGWLAVHVCAR